MKTFEIKNGDLVIGPGGYSTVSGSAKLRQDLGVAVREPYGADRFHPRWGTLLHEYVGGVLNEFTKMEVIGEVERVVGNYMGIQQEILTTNVASGRRPNFTSGEVVESVESIQVRQTYDRLHVRVILRTLSGESVSLTSTVGA